MFSHGIEGRKAGRNQQHFILGSNASSYGVGMCYAANDVAQGVQPLLIHTPWMKDDDKGQYNMHAKDSSEAYMIN